MEDNPELTSSSSVVASQRTVLTSLCLFWTGMIFLLLSTGHYEHEGEI